MTGPESTEIGVLTTGGSEGDFRGPGTVRPQSCGPESTEIGVLTTGGSEGDFRGPGTGVDAMNEGV
jgi:hypothetical protein